MTLFKWSQTAANNATADTTCPFPENMAASAYNDGMRAAMAAVAKYRDDTAGLILTAGTNTAFTVFSFQGFDSLAHLHGQEIWFTPHTTNGPGPNFLGVDGLGLKPLRSAPGVELLAATIIQGTPYSAVYNNTDGAFYLRGLFGNPFNIPLFGGMDYWDTIAPNSAMIFPVGQALSRTVFAAAFARWGTKFGAGDGSTTFNAPDKTGRVSAMTEAAAARLTSTYFGGNSTQIGAVGGGESHLLTTTEMPSHFHAAGINDPGHTHNSWIAGGSPVGGGGSFGFDTKQASLVATSSAVTGVRVASSNGLDNTYSAGGGGAHAIVQPTITCNYVIRVL